LKGSEGWGLSGDMAAVLVALLVLEAQEEVVADLLRRRMVLPLGDEAVVGSLEAKKAVVGMAALFKIVSRYWCHNYSTSHTLLRIWGVISLRVLLRWSSLRWVAPAISLIMPTVLIRRLRLCHRCIQKVLVITARFDKPFVELCKVVYRVLV
jgi:hypothetical protein